MKRIFFTCANQLYGFLPLTDMALSQSCKAVFRSFYMPTGFVLFFFVLCDPQIKWKLSMFMTFFSSWAHGGMGSCYQYIFKLHTITLNPSKAQSSRTVFMTCPNENHCLRQPHRRANIRQCLQKIGRDHVGLTYLNNLLLHLWISALPACIFCSEVKLCGSSAVCWSRNYFSICLLPNIIQTKLLSCIRYNWEGVVINFNHTNPRTLHNILPLSPLSHAISLLLK